jgi:ferredoxin-NADP reductase
MFYGFYTGAVTVSTLFFYINLALLTQLVVGVAFAIATRKKVSDSLVAMASTVVASPQTSAWSGLRAFRVLKREYEDQAQTQCSFYLAPSDGQALPDFKPGQFLTFQLSVPGLANGSAGGVTRCYSLSDSPTPAHYRITIKRAAAPAGRTNLPPGIASSYFHDQVQVGDTLQLRAPSGHFYLDAQSNTPVVLIGGGIGITPMMAMLRWSLQHQPQRVVHLYYGTRNSTEHVYKATLEEIARNSANVRLHVVYSKPLPQDVPTQDYRHQGHVDIALLKKTLPHGSHAFYICGSAPMMESLVPALVQWGVAVSDIHFEAFGPASVRLPQADTQPEPALQAPVEIHFKRSGRTLLWGGKQSNLLDFAEMHGIRVESGCRSGSCGSCLTPVVHGSVAYDNPPDYDLAAGQCLPCVGKPRTDVTLDA